MSDVDKELEVAGRIVEWFEDVLIKFRKVVTEIDGEELEPEELAKVEETVGAELLRILRRADPDMLAHDDIWLMRLFADRFIMKQDELREALEQSKRNKENASKPRADYSAIRAEYRRYVKQRGDAHGAVTHVAKKLKVSRDTVGTALKSDE